MSSRGSWFLALLFAFVAAGAGAWGYREYQQAALAGERLALQQADNARLETLVAQQKRDIASAYESAERKSIEEAVAGIRGLDFKTPVEYETVTRADIKRVLGEKLSAQYSDDDFKHISASLTAFGLLPPGFPLKEKYVALLGEQVAAFYDQHQHKLFMFEDATLHDIQNRVVLAHELTHALQDQHFGLLLMPLEVKNDDDVAIATSALIEGDATLLMGDYEAKTLSLQTLSDSMSSVFSQSTQQLELAPPYLRKMLFFPYSHGKDFCTAVFQRGGYEALSGVYKHPPTSTAQILHPDKYFAGEEPVRVEWPDTTLAGKKPTDDNVMGEFGTRVLLGSFMDEPTAAAAAGGWRGDRYLVFDDGQGVVWKTLWEDDAHAGNFRAALLRYVAKRFKHPATDTSDPACIRFSSPAFTGELISAKTGSGITLVWAATKEMCDALAEKFKE